MQLPFLKIISCIGQLRYPESTASDFSEKQEMDVADFDKNGKPDLLITGTIDGIKNLAFVILAGGNNQYKLNDVVLVVIILSPYQSSKALVTTM